MIESGVKTEEYREIKPYWIQRFYILANGQKLSKSDAEFLALDITMLYSLIHNGTIKRINYTHVKFSYGYTKRTMSYKLLSFLYGKGIPDWGAPAEDVFIIKLGKLE